jgi:hypothetical protein
MVSHWMIDAERDLVNVIREQLMGLEFLGNRVALERFNSPTINDMDCANVVSMETKQAENGGDYRLAFLVAVHILFRGDMQNRISNDGFCQPEFYDQIFDKRTQIMCALDSVRASCTQINVMPLGYSVETSADKPFAIVRFSLSAVAPRSYQ